MPDGRFYAFPRTRSNKRRAAQDVEDYIDAYQEIASTRQCPSTSGIVCMLGELWGPSDDERYIAAENGAYASERLQAFMAGLWEQAHRPPVKRVPFYAETKAAVWDMTGGECWYCGVQTNPFLDFTIDHVIPVSKGGSDDLGNLVPCCRPCNCRKSDR